MTELNNEIRELNIDEMDAVSGGARAFDDRPHLLRGMPLSGPVVWGSRCPDDQSAERR